MFWLSWCSDVTFVTGSTPVLVFNSSFLLSHECWMSGPFGTDTVLELYNVTASFGNLWMTTVVMPALSGGPSLFDNIRSCSASRSGLAPWTNNVNLPEMKNVKHKIRTGKNKQPFCSSSTKFASFCQFYFFQFLEVNACMVLIGTKTLNFPV